MATGIVRLDWIVSVRDGNYPDLSWRARAVAFALVTWADADGMCWPSIATLANALAVSRDTVKRGINELRDAGLIEVRWERRAKKRGTPWVRVFQMTMGRPQHAMPTASNWGADSVDIGRPQHRELDMELDEESLALSNEDLQRAADEAMIYGEQLDNVCDAVVGHHDLDRLSPAERARVIDSLRSPADLRCIFGAEAA